MEVLGVEIFDIVSPSQPWQDTAGGFSDALLALCWVPASESGKRRVQAGDSTTLPHIHSATAWVQFIAKYPPWKYVSIWQPMGGLWTVASGCQEINLALLSSRFSVPCVRGSCTKGLCAGRSVVWFHLLLSQVLLRNRGGLSNVSSTPSLWTFLQQVEGFNLLHNLFPCLSKAALSARFSSVSCSVFQISMCSACRARHAHSSNLNSLFCTGNSQPRRLKSSQ